MSIPEYENGENLEKLVAFSKRSPQEVATVIPVIISSDDESEMSHRTEAKLAEFTGAQPETLWWLDEKTEQVLQRNLPFLVIVFQRALTPFLFGIVMLGLFLLSYGLQLSGT